MRLLTVATTFLSILGGAGAAEAQTCTVSATGIAFGNYDPSSVVATTTSGSVTVTCSAILSLFVSYTIAITSGGGGAFSTRSMAGTSGPGLKYQVYTDPTMLTVWGDGTGGTGIDVGGYLLQLAVPVVISYPTYGRIAARQLTATGAFMDTLTVIVTY